MNVSTNLKLFLNHQQSCSSKCRSKRHVTECLAAVTQNSVEEDYVKSFLLLKCQNFWRISDEFGRNLLHLSASYGKTNILEWLLETFKFDVNSKDFESGYTALHRAFIYGQISCAQILLNHGASLNVIDLEGLTPIDILHKNSTLDHFTLNDPTEIYASGENVCFNLGLSNPVRKTYFEPVEYFSRNNLSIKQVAMSNFHTVFLASDGRVFSCGHGSGGRLGHGDENSQILPRHVTPLPSCRSVAVSNGHTLAVTEEGDAYSWGDNLHKALGHALPCDRELVPKLISLPRNFKGVCEFVGCCATTYFSVLWTPDLVCSFGRNLGQMGHSKSDGSTVLFPKQLSCMSTKNIDHVVCCDKATVVVAKKGDVYLLEDYEAKKIVNRMLDLKLAQVVIDSDAQVRIFLLTTGGKLFQWRHTDGEHKRTIFTGVTKIQYPTYLSVHTNGVLIICPNGQAYSGKLLPHVPSSSGPTTKSVLAETPTSPTSSRVLHKKQQQKEQNVKDSKSGRGFAFRETGHFIEPNECYQIALSKLTNVHRAVWSACSSDGQNSVILQQHTSVNLTELPFLGPSELRPDFERFFNETDADDDIHDVIVVCGNQSFPAHKFILASRSGYFEKNLNSTLERLIITNVDALSFREILKFIYTNECECFKVPWKGFQNFDHPQQQQNLKKSLAKGGRTLKDPLSVIVQAAKYLEIESLLKRLDDICWNPVAMETAHKSYAKNVVSKFRFDYNAFPDFHDAAFSCLDDIEIACHQCVLCARVDYFRCMFSSSWMGTSRKRIHKVNLDSHTAHSLLYYIYHDDLPTLAKIPEPAVSSLDIYCKLMIVADEWLLDRLRQMCEIKLCDLISLKNVCELLEFAQMCNADQLRTSCLQFACLNMPALVDVATNLRSLSEQSLKSLDRFYKQTHPCVAMRSIRPYTSVSVDDLELSYVLLQSSGFSVEECVEEILNQASVEFDSKQHKPKRQKVQQRRISESSTTTTVVTESSTNQAIVSCQKSTSSSSIGSNADILMARKSINSSESVESNVQQNSPAKNPSRINALSPGDNESPAPSTPHLSLANRLASATTTLSVGHRNRPWSSSSASAEVSSNVEDMVDSMVSLKQVMEMEEKAATELKSKMKQQKLISATKPIAPLPTKSRTISGGTNPWNISPQKPIAYSPPTDFTNNNINSVVPHAQQQQQQQQQQQHMTSSKLFANATIADHSESLSKIILDEEKSLQRRRDVLNKPLKYIQCEELALEELSIAYNAENNFDEFITVERYFVDPVAEPSWQAHCGSPPDKFQ